MNLQRREGEDKIFKFYKYISWFIKNSSTLQPLLTMFVKYYFLHRVKQFS